MRGPYLAGQLAPAQRAARHLGIALQRTQLPHTPSAQPPHPPAVVLLGPDNHLLGADERAELLLGEFADDSSSIFTVPTSFVMAAEQARGAAAGVRTPPSLRVQGRDGSWYVLHASPRRGERTQRGGDHPATPADIMPAWTCRTPKYNTLVSVVTQSHVATGDADPSGRPRWLTAISTCHPGWFRLRSTG